jgi:hypothetical protein
VSFIGNKAYVLVTLVSDDVGGDQVDGIYRVDGPGTFTVIADLGTFSRTHPPLTPFDVPTGLQFALRVTSHLLLLRCQTAASCSGCPTMEASR